MSNERELRIKPFVTSLILIFICLILLSAALVFWSGVSGYLSTGDTAREVRSLADRLHAQILTIISNDPSSSPELDGLRQEATEIRLALSEQPEFESLSKEELQNLTSRLEDAIENLNFIASGSKEYRNSLIMMLGEINNAREAARLLDPEPDILVSSIIRGTKDFWSWVGPSSLFSLILILIVLFVATRENWMRSWLGPGSEWSLEFGGFKFGAKSLENEKGEMAKAQKELEGRISDQYESLIAQLRLDDFFDGFFKRLSLAIGCQGFDINTIPHRRTYFVPTYITEGLIQAAEYRGHEYTSNAKKFGRIFSVRYGIIGMAWRLRRPLYNPIVNNQNDELIRVWGLTQKEAKNQGAGHRSLLAFPIPRDDSDSDPLGVIFVEGLSPNAFGTPSDTAECEKFALRILNQAKSYPEFKDFVDQLNKLESQIRWSSKLIRAEGR